MPFKVEISADTWEEIREEARRIAGYAISNSVDGDQEESEELADRLRGSGWSYDELVRLWSEVNPNARQVLAEIATQPAPKGYLWWEVAPNLDLEKGQLGGRMSSIGFALKRAFPGKSNPVNYTNGTDRYMMHPGVAQVFLELAADEIGE